MSTRFRSLDGSCWYTTTSGVDGDTTTQISIIHNSAQAQLVEAQNDLVWRLIQEIRRHFEKKVAARVCIDASAFSDGLALLAMQTPASPPEWTAVRLSRGAGPFIELALVDLDAPKATPMASVTVDASSVDRRFPTLAFDPGMLMRVAEDMQEWKLTQLNAANLEVPWIGRDAILRVACNKFEAYIAPMR